MEKKKRVARLKEKRKRLDSKCAPLKFCVEMEKLRKIAIQDCYGSSCNKKLEEYEMAYERLFNLISENEIGFWDVSLPLARKTFDVADNICKRPWRGSTGFIIQAREVVNPLARLLKLIQESVLKNPRTCNLEIQ